MAGEVERKQAGGQEGWGGRERLERKKGERKRGELIGT